MHVAKPLEPLLRRLALATIKPRGNRLAGPLDPATIRRVMIYRPQRFGDLLATLPILRALRSGCPHWHLSLWTSTQGKELILPEGLTDELRVFSGRAQDRVKSIPGSFDLVLDLVAHDSVNALAVCARAAGGGVLAGFGKQRLAPYYDWARAYPSADRYAPYGGLKVLDLFGSLTPGDFGPRFTPEEEAFAASLTAARKQATVVNLSARHHWPEEEWAQVIAFLIERRQTPVFINAIGEERARAARLAAGHGDDVREIPAEATFREVACVVSRAALLISPDTSLVHISGPAGIPTVALFTRRHDFRLSWIPEGDHVRVLQATAPETLAEIPAAAVCEAVASLDARAAHRERA